MKKLLFLLPLFIQISCNSGKNDADAFGNFEATEVIVSAEANGQLIDFSAEEGMEVKQAQKLGLVDTTQLYLKKRQLTSSIVALKNKVQNVNIQINVLQEQKQNLIREKQRLVNLFKDNAATQKQLDDINGEIEVVNSKILATKDQMTTSNEGLLSEIAPLEAQIEQINDQVAKSYIISPTHGTILTNYVEKGEFVTMGKPMFKIADLSKMKLRVYVSGDQLANIKLGQEVEVIVDKNKDTNRSLKGKINWIASQAEFTPKIIQTKEERVNLVYAVKVEASNDGFLKIGMPGEVNFDISNE